MLKKIHFSLFVIFLLAFLAGNLVYPQYFNQGIDYLNSKFQIKLPHFPEKPFKLGLDLQGGVHLVYQADLSGIEEKDRGNVMDGLRDVIERRVNLFGVREPVVQVQGERLIVELSGTVDPGQAVKEIGKTPFLEFKEELSAEERDKIFQTILGERAKEIPSDAACRDMNFLIQFILSSGQDPCFKATPLTGRYLKRAELAFDNQVTSEPIVSLEFNDEGAKIFEELTSKNVGKILAIYIDGVPISTPVVQEKIAGGKARITGNFTIEQAKELARNLSAGALPAPITLISQQTVGPILGKISLEQSLKAGTFGFLAILIFMILLYRIPGFFASISLLIYAAFNLALYQTIPVTLTLAGIAGFLLSMGMAVDANILIFSRMREEARKRKDFLVSLEEGSRRAWPAIRDGNLTTILVGLVLFLFGASFVKGFALTLIIGNLIGMFTAIVVTNNLLKIFAKGFQKWLWLW